MSVLLSLLRDQWAASTRHALTESSGRVVSGPELLQRVEQWTNLYRGSGVGPGTLVGIHLARSIDQVAALFAALGCGAAYVPLDRTYPAQRLAFMVDDVGISVIAGTPTTEFGRQDVRWLRPPSWDSVAAPSASTAEVSLSSQDDNPARGDALAYVMYTSGSTGNPKGVRISESNVLAFLRSWDSLFANQANGVWLALTSLSFDPSLVELIWTLVRGWSVVLAPDQPTAGVVGELINRHGVTHLQCTPTRASMLLAEPTDRLALPNLQRMFVGGESLTASLARELTSIVPTVTNIYGPTETTVWAFAYDVDGATPDEIVDPVPIGRPLPGVTAVLLDEHLRPVDSGTIGELLLIGDDVSDGYHQRPERTARAFLTFNESTAYRTGDLARLRADGLYEFLGRADNQLKVAGNRIEPAEIESILCRVAGVELAVVTAKATPAGTKRLVAYVQGAAVDDSVTAQLLAVCSASLPPSHVPSRIIRLDQLPLTPSGKVDRARLPEPEWSTEPARASGHGQEVDDMRTLWSRALGVCVGPDDDFFALGGDSLAALTIVAEIVRTQALSLGLAALVDAPTPRLLAEFTKGKVASTASLVRIRPVTEPSHRLVLVHGAGGNVVNFKHVASRIRPGVEVLAFQAHALVNPGAVQDITVEAMATRYLDELDAEPAIATTLCGYSDGGVVAWEMAAQGRNRGMPVSTVVLLDTGVLPTVELSPPHVRALNALRNVRDRQRPLAEFLRDATAAQRRPRVVPQVRDEEASQLGRLLDVQAEVEAAAQRYTVRPSGVSIELIRSRHTPIAVWSDFRWRRFGSSLNISFVRGSHREMVASESADELAAAIEEALDRAISRLPASAGRRG